MSRVCVLTGSSRGLGLALAEELRRLDVTVVGTSRTEGVDVSDGEQVRAFAERVLAEHGPPDLLLNNAGLINRNAPLWEVPAEEFSQVIDVNIKGTFHVLAAFLPAMIKRGTGIIVNFSSGWGRTTAPEVAPYCCAKYGIEGLTQALSQELPAGLAAVAFNPGIIDTEMLQSCFGPSAASYQKPGDWARKAAPYLLGLSGKDNGRSLTLH